MTGLEKAIQEGMSRTTEIVEKYGEVPNPEIEDNVETVYNRILLIRSYMTSLAGVLADSILIKTRAKVELSIAESNLEMAEAEAVSTGKTRTTEYFSGQERKANLRAKTLELEIAKRRARELYDTAYGFHEFVRVHHSELDRAVRDVETRIRILNNFNS